MTCSVLVLLPFTLSVPDGAVLPPMSFRMESYVVTINPPVQSAIHLNAFGLFSDQSMTNQIADLVPASTQTPDGRLKIDGAAALQADLLLIEFRRGRFDRRVLVTPAGSLQRMTLMATPQRHRSLRPQIGSWELYGTSRGTRIFMNWSSPRRFGDIGTSTLRERGFARGPDTSVGEAPLPSRGA